MKNNHIIKATGLVATAAFLAACSSPMPPARSSTTYPAPVTSYPAPSTSPAYASSYGVVESIQMVGSSGGSGGIGAGAVIGGVVGGALGNQVGSGSGQTAATVAGTLGGAAIGHQVQQRNREQDAMYQIGIRLDNGSYQTVTQESLADLSVGSRVRIENGRAYRY